MPDRIILETRNAQLAAVCAARAALAAASGCIEAVAACALAVKAVVMEHRAKFTSQANAAMKEQIRGRPFVDTEENDGVIYRVLQDTVFVNDGVLAVEYYNWSNLGNRTDSELADTDVFWSPFEELAGFADWSRGKASATAAVVAVPAAVLVDTLTVSVLAPDVISVLETVSGSNEHVPYVVATTTTPPTRATLTFQLASCVFNHSIIIPPYYRKCGTLFSRPGCQRSLYKFKLICH